MINLTEDEWVQTRDHFFRELESYPDDIDPDQPFTVVESFDSYPDQTFIVVWSYLEKVWCVVEIISYESL